MTSPLMDPDPVNTYGHMTNHLTNGHLANGTLTNGTSKNGLKRPNSEILENDKPAKLSRFQKEWPDHPGDVPIAGWDSAVFISELLNLRMLSPDKLVLTEEDRQRAKDNPEYLLKKAAQVAPKPLENGTYRGTQLALTKLYDLIEKKYAAYMDAVNFEPTVPSNLPLYKKRNYYVFSDPSTDHFPPHLNLARKVKDPMSDKQRARIPQEELFDKMRLAQMTNLLPKLIPNNFLAEQMTGIYQTHAYVKLGGMGRPDQGTTIAEIERYNTAQRSATHAFATKDIFNFPNIGDLEDWYTDHRFAQQHFTGTNPTTIELASDFWIKHFIDNATDPEEQSMKDKIERLSDDKEQRARLYMQDYSYFRKACGMKEDEEISSVIPVEQRAKDAQYNDKRVGVASVCLFHLAMNNKLEPLAIVIDWRGSADKSLTVYNKELPEHKQATDWGWRYAKTCVQTADWMRHEVTAHLTNTHLIEESTIVAAQQCFENDHPVLRLLYPHWQKTLSLNASARDTLVPHVIAALIGFEEQETYKFIQHEYNTFDFQGNYVPADLKRRGFDPNELDQPKYRNYAYARCIHSMWYKIRAYVDNMLQIYYKSDEDVVKDGYIREWYEALQRSPSPDGSGGANIKTFPTIKTYEDLVDAVTMCIHLASPQHTAVNYLQNYYQAFVINKPPCLYTSPPTTKAQLYDFTEQDLVDALPINHTREWLLASHIPYLLSFKPGDKESLIIFAASKWHLYKGKTIEEEDHADEIADAALKFYQSLAKSEEEFATIARETWDSDVVVYDVLSPSWNAVSILI